MPLRPVPAADAVLVSKAIAILERHHPRHLNPLIPQFTPQAASSLLLQAQSHKPVALKFIDWARPHPFFNTNLNPICISLHILTNFNLYKTAHSLAEGIIVNSNDPKGLALFSELKDSYHACNSTSGVFDLIVKALSL
ncbi:hypothetical protein LIER_22346 [Lithospermum erythrorhizon]|uniref:Pentatricopeptide repeat-containing protein n=1 Tax=Lithospermum erythrorhizon TaxID=34254 RepID=A0AAV3QWS3_LITER